jgi:hypothetical protein
VLAVPASAAPQCQLCAPQSQAAAAAKKPPPRAISISIETTLDFSRIGLSAVNQGGTARIDPVTGQRILTGMLVDLGGIPVTGTVLVRGEPNEQVQVSLPAGAQLFNASGASYSLSDFTSTLKNNPKFDQTGVLRFTFGALLRVGGAATGSFRGSIPIVVDYK